MASSTETAAPFPTSNEIIDDLPAEPAAVVVEVARQPSAPRWGVFSLLWRAVVPPAATDLEAAPADTEMAAGSSGPECYICMSPASFGPAACGHEMCRRCAVQYVREQLGHREANVKPLGLRCPQHVSGCDAFIDAQRAAQLLSTDDLQRLDDQAKGTGPVTRRVQQVVNVLRAFSTAWFSPAARAAELPPARQLTPPVVLRQLTPHAESERAAAAECLSVDDVLKLERYTVEAVLDERERYWCPACHALCLLPEEVLREMRRPPPSRLARALLALGCRRRPPTDVKCPHCSHHWDPLKPDARGSYAERATQALISLTTKQCPTCGYGISHFQLVSNGAHPVRRQRPICLRGPS